MRLLPLRVGFQGKKSLTFPSFAANGIRGALGAQLRKIACHQKDETCRTCQARFRCAYALIFEPTVPPGSACLRNLNNIPRPYIIDAAALNDRTFRHGEIIPVHGSLFGEAIHFLPTIIEAFAAAGREGLGDRDLKATLRSIETLGTSGWKQISLIAPLRESDLRPLVINPMNALTKAADVSSEPLEKVTLEILTPLRLKRHGKVSTRFNFGALVATILRRMSTLAFFHDGETIDGDFAGVRNAANEIEVLRDDTRWYSQQRFSHRQKEGISMSGLLGKITLKIPAKQWTPLLTIGSVIGVGRGAAFGLGRFRLLESNERNQGNECYVTNTPLEAAH